MRDTRMPSTRSQASRMAAKASQDGCAIIPLSVYFSGPRVKLELGICKGKKLHDKRDAAAERSAKREIDKAMKEKNNR